MARTPAQIRGLHDESIMMNRWSSLAKRIRVPMGFVFAVVFLLLARPAWQSLVWSLIPVGAGLWLRGYASGYVKKNTELTVTGPYAHTRNPLYLGSMLIAFGFAVASRSVYIWIALILLFAAIYIPVIRSEEEFLKRTFPRFEEYCRTVPRWLPRLTQARRAMAEAGGDTMPGSFSAALYRKHREYNALMGAGAIYLVLLVRLYLRL